MSALIDENPDYRTVTVMRVDWDEHRGGDIVQEHSVLRRSTLVMLNGGEEVGRVIGSARRDDIEALFKAVI